MSKVKISKPITAIVEPVRTSKQKIQQEKKLLERVKNTKKVRKVDVQPDYSLEGDYPGSEMRFNKGQWNHKVLIGTPTTGVVRMEWVMARYGQVIPTNWSMMDSYMPLPHSFAPMAYLVPDAQNLIVKSAIEKKVEWLLLIEQDNLLPPDAFIRFNEYMRSSEVPVVSGLYFTKSVPPEPMIYRGIGDSYVRDWKLGERVWCTGVPTGALLIHMSILHAMWEDAPEYNCQGQVTRRVFEAPEKVWFDPQSGGFRTEVGTSDLKFCRQVIEEGYFEKAGWPEYQKMQNPFLVDTNLFVKHIDMDGRMFPLEIPEEYLENGQPVTPRDNGKV